MHMADALISPTVGGLFWAAAALTAVKSARTADGEGEDQCNVLMGVLAALVFAAQMINFAIPGTGSSGHISGGMLLAILLGRERAFLSMTVILTVQALFFADGGLLALGCNLFNIGFLPCYCAYPLVYKKISAAFSGRRAIFAASLLASVTALLLGAFFVTVQTLLSGITAVPFSLFLALMLPVHLVIGMVEGAITALAVLYLLGNEPALLSPAAKRAPAGRGGTLSLLLLATFLIGGALSLFASSLTDGLEWSLERARAELGDGGGLHALSSRLQKWTAFLPDYAFKGSEEGVERLSASFSGVLGSTLTLAIAGAAAIFFGKRQSGR